MYRVRYATSNFNDTELNALNKAVSLDFSRDRNLKCKLEVHFSCVKFHFLESAMHEGQEMIRRRRIKVLNITNVQNCDILNYRVSVTKSEGQ